MKKTFVLMIALGLLASACGTSAKPSVPSGAAVNPSPVAAVDLQATAAFMVKQTMQAMPTPTLMPSNTPIVFTETPTSTSTPNPKMAASETQNPILLTLTATLGTGTPATIIPTDGPPVATMDLSTPTETDYPRTYGTMPPDLPSGKIFLFNKSKANATISLHCTTTNGTITYIEYPVEGKMTIKGPAGSYHFVAWVGGKMFTGNFRLSIGGDALVFLYADHVETK